MTDYLAKDKTKVLKQVGHTSCDIVFIFCFSCGNWIKRLLKIF